MAKVETLTKANSKIKRVMIQTKAHVEEEIFEEGGAKEDVEIIKGMMRMLVIVDARIVAD